MFVSFGVVCVSFWASGRHLAQLEFWEPVLTAKTSAKVFEVFKNLVGSLYVFVVFVVVLVLC